MKSVYPIDTPIGRLHAEEEDGRLAALHLPNSPAPAYEGEPQTALREQLAEYFAGTRKTFDIPLALDGPPFLHRARMEALKIPYGQTTTYEELATAAGSPKASRAVGQAMATNPLPILVPCHRVLYSHGKKQSYAGGPEMKEFLLKLEWENR